MKGMDMGIGWFIRYRDEMGVKFYKEYIEGKEKLIKYAIQACILDAIPSRDKVRELTIEAGIMTPRRIHFDAYVNTIRGVHKFEIVDRNYNTIYKLYFHPYDIPELLEMIQTAQQGV